MSRILRLSGETWLSVWGRRAVSVPLLFALSALMLAVSLVAFALCASLDALRPSDRRWPRTRALGFFYLYLGCETLGVLAAASLWLLRLAGRGTRATAYVRDNAALQRYFTDALFFGAVRLFAMKVDVDGDGDLGQPPFLLFVRHASTADTVLAAALLANRHRLLMRYVLKRELLWDPCLDIVGRRLPNAFVERSKDKTEGDIAALVSLTRGLDSQSAVLIFPEGTRFSSEKLRAARQRLAEHADAELQRIANDYRQVLPPKLGGPLALLEAAPGIDVVFLEHTGFEGARSFAQFFAGGLIGRTIHARFRRVSPAAIPSAERARWLFEQWLICDRYVTAHMSQERENL